MPLGQATTKSIEVTYFSLVAPSDFIDCLVDLLAIDYTGSIAVTKDVAGNPQWEMSIQQTVTASSRSVNALRAGLGEVLIWDGQILKALPQADFDAQYNVA